MFLLRIAYAIGILASIYSLQNKTNPVVGCIGGFLIAIGSGGWKD